MKLLKFRKYEIRAREERPEGAMSTQPRATPWVQTAKVTFALKGQKLYNTWLLLVCSPLNGKLLPFQGAE